MPKSKDTHVRIPEGIHERLRIEAERQGRTVSNLLVYLVKQGLDRLAPPKPDPRAPGAAVDGAPGAS